jgi:anthranilate synthase/aminodeoxychorismate synthase-like glutamine amidotransferase
MRLDEMILMIDNFDSFTYNLVQACEMLGAEVVVRRNNCTLKELKDLQPEHLLVSPGPCTPNEAGVSLDAISYFAGRIPVLGVCLGHQALGQAFGARVVRAKSVMHGKTSLIHHTGDKLFAGVPPLFQATRYHSLIVEQESLPDSFEVIADCEEVVMGLNHRETGARGVQFHPESILTHDGNTILNNFITS